jgi:hypothetical protein
MYTPVIFAILTGFVGGLVGSVVWTIWPRHRVVNEEVDLRARSFTLVNEQGQPRAMLGFVSGEATFLIGDEETNPRVRLSAGSQGTPIVLQLDGGTRAILLTIEGENIFLRLTENQRGRVGVGILDDGSAGIDVADRSGKARADLRLAPNGTVSLTLLEETGKASVKLESARSGAPTVVMVDSAGNPLARIP